MFLLVYEVIESIYFGKDVCERLSKQTCPNVHKVFISVFKSTIRMILNLQYVILVNLYILNHLYFREFRHMIVVRFIFLKFNYSEITLLETKDFFHCLNVHDLI